MTVAMAVAMIVATENMERAHQNEHSKRANAMQIKDTLNTMPGGELK